MKKLKIGLLPMYIRLYDDSWPELRKRVDAFHGIISTEIEAKGIEVINVPVCRIKPEFEAAIGKFKEAEVNAVVTLHLAYSPSLESADVLAATKLPLIVLDTTPTYEYSPLTDPDELFYNHGIHGVQDMCNLLIRNDKPFMLEAGHWKESDVLDRVISCVRSAAVAQNMKGEIVYDIKNWYYRHSRSEYRFRV